MENSKTAVDRSLISRRHFIQGTMAVGTILSTVSKCESAQEERQDISLDGTWQLYFDRQRRWVKKDWITDFLSSSTKRVQIPWAEMRASMEREAIEFHVPATWEEYRPDTVGEGWYWKEVVIPEAQFPRSVRLQFNAVRYGAEVYWNGQRVGLYLGGFTPFTLNLSSLAKPGACYQLAVRVVNPGGGFAGDWEKLFFENIQIPQSHNFGGIWQPVRMIITSPVFVEDVFVEPRVSEKTAVAHVTVINHTPGTQRITLDAHAALRESPMQHAGKAHVTISVPGNRKLTVPMRVNLDPLILWEPTCPARYRLEVSLRGSSPAFRDNQAVTFGMRQFTVEGRFFYLNGRKFMVKSTINHQYYPITVGYPPTPDFARQEVEVALQSGLNMMHIHRQIGHPDLIEWADELGLLLYEEPGGVIFDQHEHLDYPGIRLLMRQLADLIARDRNHPAVVAWGMSNENILDPDVISRMMQTTRALDPTRVVCDNSGHGIRMLHPYKESASPWRDLHIYPPAPIESSTYRSMNQFGQPPGYGFRRADGVEVLPPMPEVGPQIIGEFGYGGLPDFPGAVRKFQATGKTSIEGANCDHSLKSLKRGFSKYDLAPIFGTVSEFCRQTDAIHANAQAEMLQALRTNPFNSGYAVSCFHDLAIWYCGITDIFRDPKPVSRRLAEVNVPLFPAIEAEPSPAWADQETTVRCVLVNENVLKGPARLSVSITGPDGEKVFEKSRSLELSPGRGFVAPVFEEPVRLGGPSGHYVIRVGVEGNNGHGVLNQRRLYALNRRDILWPSRPVMLFDPANHLVPFFARWNIPYQLCPSHTKANQRTVLFADMEKWHYYEHREDTLREVRAILANCHAGSTVVFLFESRDGLLVNLVNDLEIHPGPLRLVNTTGNFRGDFHYVKPHPLFGGLPTRTCMDREYRNVIARFSMDGFDGETIAGCNENAYWWGTDVGVIQMGSVAVVLSTLRLSQNLGVDPVAERIVSNFATWRIR